MARILITSGPTRQYLDPVRYLTNASSGRMGAAIATAAVDAGHEVVIISGPVQIPYPSEAKVVPVVTTEDMLQACLEVFPGCDGLIGVAAPCDYCPAEVARHKLRKTGKTLELQLVETPDVLARLAAVKRSQWMVAFALETEDTHLRAIEKLHRKQCDLIVLNGPTAIHAHQTRVELLDRQGTVLADLTGEKSHVAVELFKHIDRHLIRRDRAGEQGSGGAGEEDTERK